jgi:hypothetical protein
MKNIKNTILILFLILLAISCKSYDVNSFKEISYDHIDKSESILIMDYSMSLRESYKIQIDSIVYYASFTELGVVKGLYTFDTNFVSKDGLKVGDSFFKAQKESFKDYRYYQHLTLFLNSGWKAVFYSGSTFNDSTKIIMFEKWASDIYTD